MGLKSRCSFCPANEPRDSVALAKLLEKNVDMVVNVYVVFNRVGVRAREDKAPPEYQVFSRTGSDSASYNVVTDMDGHILAILGSREPRGLVEPWINPVDLIVVPYLAGKAVVLAGRAAILVGEALPSAAALGIGAKNAIWTLARRGSARLAGGARAVFSRVFRREVEGTGRMVVVEQLTGSVTKEKLEAYLSNLRNTRSYFDRLVRARGLQADELTAETIQAMEGVGTTTW